jgi:hypothetical protein
MRSKKSGDYAFDMRKAGVGADFFLASSDEERAGVRSLNLSGNKNPLTLTLSPLGRREGN